MIHRNFLPHRRQEGDGKWTITCDIGRERFGKWNESKLVEPHTAGSWSPAALSNDVTATSDIKSETNKITLQITQSDKRVASAVCGLCNHSSNAFSCSMSSNVSPPTTRFIAQSKVTRKEKQFDDWVASGWKLLKASGLFWLLVQLISPSLCVSFHATLGWLRHDTNLGWKNNSSRTFRSLVAWFLLPFRIRLHSVCRA